jgi:hypothetical protein
VNTVFPHPPAKPTGKNRFASAKFPFVRSLFRDFFARLINFAPLSFDHRIENAFIDVFSISFFLTNVNGFFIFLPYKIDKQRKKCYNIIKRGDLNGENGKKTRVQL